MGYIFICIFIYRIYYNILSSQVNGKRLVLDCFLDFIFLGKRSNYGCLFFVDEFVSLIPKHYFIANGESVTIDPVNCTKNFIKYKNNRIAVNELVYFVR